MARLEIYIPSDEYRTYLEDCAAKEGISVSAYIRLAIKFHQEELISKMRAGE